MTTSNERFVCGFTLPKLTDLGLVEYDHRSQTVRYCGPPVVGELLAVVTESDSESDE